MHHRPLAWSGSIQNPRISRVAGFSLIELLVVVSIIVMLIALILPNLVSTRKVARRVICAGRLKELDKTLRTFRANPMGDPQYSIAGPGSWLSYTEAFGSAAALYCPEDGDLVGGLTSPDGIIRYLPERPSSMVFNQQHEDANQIFTFRERESYELPSAINVNITQPGYYPTPGSMGGGTIPAGTVVDSFFMHFDTIGRQHTVLSGTFSVGGKIIGIICVGGQLDATDPKTKLGWAPDMANLSRKTGGMTEARVKVAHAAGRV